MRSIQMRKTGFSFKTYLSVLIGGICLMLISGGCESTPTEVDKYNPEPVLTAFVYNGEPIEEVFLERVGPLFSTYRFEDFGITNADIKIFEIGGNDTLHLSPDPAKDGRYVPTAGELMIPKSRTNYKIEAQIPGAEFLWAEAAVPDKFDTLEVVLIDGDGNIFNVQDGDTLTRNHPNMFWRWDIDTTGGFVGGYAGLIVAETPRDSLVPLDPDWDAVEDSLEDNERGRAGWTVFRHDALWTTIAWAFFNWEGPNRIELQAVSRDYWDYLYSSMRVQQGMLENPIFNINGGLGIFGGISRRSFTIYLKKVEPTS